MAAKILVVDDNPDIVEMITVRLEANNYQVITALSGQEALDKIKQEVPDLILLDIAMPEMDGFEVGRRLKMDPDTKKIPVIMVTARSEHKDVLRSITEAGALDYVAKPFRPDILLKRIKDVLRRAGK